MEQLKSKALVITNFDLDLSPDTSDAVTTPVNLPFISIPHFHRGFALSCFLRRSWAQLAEFRHGHHIYLHHPWPMTTSASSTVSGVLQSTHQRRAVCTKRLSNEQLIHHGRGAQTLRNTSLFDATIPFGFTPISSSSIDTSTPSNSSSIPSSSQVLSPPPFAPLMIQSNAKESDGGSFVFARRSDAPTTPAVVSSPPAAILNVFLPLSIPPHLSPRSTPGPETTWTDVTPRRPTLSRSLPSEPWVGSGYLEDIPDEEEEEKHEDPTPTPKPRKPPTKRPKTRRAITNENSASLSAFFS